MPGPTAPRQRDRKTRPARPGPRGRMLAGAVALPVTLGMGSFPLLLATRDWFDVATGLAQMVTALAIVAVAVFAAGAAWALRSAMRGMARTLEGAQAEVVPLLKQARAIADDVQGMTTAAREEVARVRGLVSETSARAEAALDAVEGRLRRLDALAGLVQDEAEDAVVSLVATARGATATLGIVRRLLGLGRDPGRPRRDARRPEGRGAEPALAEGADAAPSERPRVRRRPPAPRA